MVAGLAWAWRPCTVVRPPSRTSRRRPSSPSRLGVLRCSPLHMEAAGAVCVGTVAHCCCGAGSPHVVVRCVPSARGGCLRRPATALLVLR
eukprot:9190845-Alexandrium_andersonii.AAC.1